MTSEPQPAADGNEDRGGATVVFAVLMDGALTAAKLVGFLATGSASLLAETFHSGAETVNQGLLLWGRRRATGRPAEPEHPFGYSRERYFWPFIVAVLIFAVGALGSLYRGYVELTDPEPLRDVVWAYAVLGAALLFDGASWVNALRQARAVKGRRSLWRFVRRTREPEIPMVLLEDTAAVIGVLFAFLGVGLAELTGNPIFDAIGSIAIGLLLVAVAGVLAREMKSLLIGESALPEEETRIRAAITEQPEFAALVYLRTLYLGPDDLLVESKIEVADGVDGQELARAIDAAEARVRERVPHTGIIAIEPDIPQPDDPDRPEYDRGDASRGGG